MGNKESSPNWKPDQSTSVCDGCAAPFSLVRRRHHCRNCGGLFCDACSEGRLTIPNRGFDSKVRVCSVCMLRLDAESVSSSPVTPTRRRSDVLPRSHLSSPPRASDTSSSAPSRHRLMLPNSEK